MAHLRYAELSGYCRNENASSPSFPRGSFGKFPRPLFGNPTISLRRPVVLRPRLTTGLPFSQSTKGGASTQRVVMTETSGAVKGGAKEWIEKALGWTVEIVQHSPKTVSSETARVWAEE